MALDSCMKCIKYSLFVFNFLFWLLGTAILSIGIYAKLRAVEVMGQSIGSHFAVVLIVVGAVMMVVGFFGCCGAIRESQCLLVSFFIFLLIILIALVACGITVILYGTKISKAVHEDMTDLVEKLKSTNMTVRQDAFKKLATVQNETLCCGVDHGEQDYVTAHIPPEGYPHCDPEYKNVGCIPRMTGAVSILVWICLGTAAILLIGLVLSMCLCCAIRQSYA